jgi:hypothetical protein
VNETNPHETHRLVRVHLARRSRRGAGDWSIPYFSDDLAQYKNDELHDSDALLSGRTTYEGFAAAWPKMEAVEPRQNGSNSLPRMIESTLVPLDGVIGGSKAGLA